MRVETKRTLKRFLKNPSTIIGLSILVFFTLVAVFAPLIAPPVSPMNPENRISDPYIMPKITWKADPIPPVSKSQAKRNLMAKGLEKIIYKKSADEIRAFVEKLISSVDAHAMCEVSAEVYKFKGKVKEELKKHLKELRESGLTNPESLINSYMKSDLLLVCGRAIEAVEGFSDFLLSFKKELDGLKKGDLIKVYKVVSRNVTYDVLSKNVSAFLGIEGDPYEWLMEKGYIKRKPIITIDYHPFGMIDGRDIFYGVVWGTRTAFRIGLIVTAFSTVIGLFIGSISGYYGGWIDETLMRITDVFLSIPFLVAAIVLTTFLGSGLDKVMIAMIIFGWMGTARLIRGNILQVKEEQFILAAKALGVRDTFIIVKHVLPNTIFPVVIQASMRMGSLVITAAALSFLGLGAPTGYADWGALLNYSRDWILGAQGEAFKYWFALFYPGTAMVLFVLAWNLLGDALRDTFDPRLRG